MLGVSPSVGRFYTPREDVGRNVSPYIVLSHDYWTAHLASDPGVAGRAIRINGQPYTILGVAPEGFYGTEVFFRPDFWIPMTMAQQVEGSGWIDLRTSRNVYVAGRLNEGTTQAQAQSALDHIATSLGVEYPAVNRDLKVTLTTPGLFGDALRTPASAFVGVTLLLAMLVLLAACANLAILLAARVVDRYRELAVRLSLGATRGGVARQLFVETLLLCMCGAVIGMLVAMVPLRMLTRWRPTVGFPFAVDVLPDFQVVVFAALMSIAAAFLAVGAATARAWRVDTGSLMRGATEGVRLGRWSVRDALLGVQVSLCSLLVISCFVSIQGLISTFDMPLGFNPAGVFVASFDLNQRGYDRARGQLLRSQMLDALAAKPGIDGVTFTSSIQLTTDQSTDAVVADVAPASSDSHGIDAKSFIVPPGYFDVMQTRLVSGRDFNEFDTRVAIINATLARQLLGTTEVVGRGIRRAPGLPLIQVVGVAEDGQYAVPGEVPRPAIYWPALQLYRSSTQLLIRSRLPEEQVAILTRETITALDSSLPVTVQGSLREVTSLAFLPAKAAAVILGTLGLLALVLAFGGIYGLAAYSVSARGKEIGIRLAVGGRSTQILNAILGRVASVLVIGAAAGVALAIASGPLLSLVVYQASSRDARVLSAAGATMVLIGLAAAWTAARRALRVDPAVTLRDG